MKMSKKKNEKEKEKVKNPKIDCPGLKFFEKQRVSPLNFSTFSPFS
jgi:hypothetical protein